MVRGQRSVDREGRKGGNLFSDVLGRRVGAFRAGRNLLDQTEVEGSSSNEMITWKVLSVKNNYLVIRMDVGFGDVMGSKLRDGNGLRDCCDSRDLWRVLYCWRRAIGEKSKAPPSKTEDGAP